MILILGTIVWFIYSFVVYYMTILISFFSLYERTKKKIPSSFNYTRYNIVLKVEQKKEEQRTKELVKRFNSNPYLLNIWHYWPCVYGVRFFCSNFVLTILDRLVLCKHLLKAHSSRGLNDVDYVLGTYTAIILHVGKVLYKSNL